MTTPASLAVSQTVSSSGTTLQGGSRPVIPSTPESARAAEPWFRQRAIDACRRYEAAKREFLNCRGELEIVLAVKNGDFEPEPGEPTHATGSSGAWPVRRQYREISLDDWARA